MTEYLSRPRQTKPEAPPSPTLGRLLFKSQFCTYFHPAPPKAKQNKTKQLP